MTDRTLTAPRAGSIGWIVPGALAGIVAGITFAMFEMIMAALTKGADAFFMPLRMIGAIGIGISALDPTATALATTGGAGLIIHMALSMMYGVGVAGLFRLVPSIGRTTTSILSVASAGGLVLWVVNFLVLARIFGWAWFPDATNAPIQVVAHTVFFGTVLGAMLVRLGSGASEA